MDDNLKKLVISLKSEIDRLIAEQKKTTELLEHIIHDDAVSNLQSKLNSEQYLQISIGLKTAIQNHEFFLVYHPVMDLQTNKPYAIEALIRWKHPQLGLLMPDQFLFLAEKIGVMRDIGEWMIQQACDDYKNFNLQLSLAFNLSTHELDNDKITDIIINHVQKNAIPPQNIIIELTETSIMQHPEKTVEKFQVLSNFGIKIAVDDYGTGYSSLTYLKQLPLTLLKIDRSFISNINTDSTSAIIIESTIKLAHSLGLKVVAEGVETQEQLDFLKKQGCDYAQGYFFTIPLEMDSLVRYIKG